MPWEVDGEPTLIDSQTLRQRVELGTIAPHTLIRKEGGNWTQADKVKGLHFPPAPAAGNH